MEPIPFDSHIQSNTHSFLAFRCHQLSQVFSNITRSPRLDRYYQSLLTRTHSISKSDTELKKLRAPAQRSHRNTWRPATRARARLGSARLG